MALARRTASAERDLQSISIQFALNEDRPTAADRIIVELIQQAERLAEFSQHAELGTALPEIGAGVRAFSYKRWVILFRYQPHTAPTFCASQTAAKIIWHGSSGNATAAGRCFTTVV